MGIFTKDAQKRLTDTFDYIDAVATDPTKVDLLRDWVYVDGHYAPATISDALSLDVGPWGKLTGSTTQRRAVRSAALARLAAEAPADLGPMDLWISSYKDLTTTVLDAEINAQLAKIRGPQPMPMGSISPPMGAYANLGQVLGAKGALKPVVKAPVVGVQAPPMPPGESGTINAKKGYFDDVSRIHVILSGHGSWQYDAGSAGWPRVTLGKQQEMRCYVRHYYPLKNDVGQLVDNRRFPVPTSTYAGGSQMPDYTLHHKDTLVLLNHSKNDVHFVTVNSDTRVSTFLNKAEYASAIFHWAACRVVFNSAGKVACPTHNGWEDYGGAAPLPCVLR